MNDSFTVTVWNADTTESGRFNVRGRNSATAESKALRLARKAFGDGMLTVTKISLTSTPKRYRVTWYAIFTTFNKWFARPGLTTVGIGPRQAVFILRIHNILHHRGN